MKYLLSFLWVKQSHKDKLHKNLKKMSEQPIEKYVSLKIPCALLTTDGQCSIYEWRPLSCRRWLSYDVKACETAFKAPSGEGEVPLDAGIFAIGIGIEDELVKKLAAKALDDTYCELNSGLIRALQSDDLE